MDIGIPYAAAPVAHRVLIELLSLFAQPVSVIGKNEKNLRKKSGNAVSIQLAFITAYPLNNWRRSKGVPGSLDKPSDRGELVQSTPLRRQA
ncbi:TPA: hypothetical protein QIF01_001125 [Serratia marcescens]|uniref:hypothetical protein n=1 Tax=Serratia marcescens TaxID=615 RepID=UPI0007DA1A0D|nr:hypothetical protein [Serratia marcescens]HEO8932387.1 hypothetical protein [Serratia marcescens]